MSHQILVSLGGFQLFGVFQTNLRLPASLILALWFVDACAVAWQREWVDRGMRGAEAHLRGESLLQQGFPAGRPGELQHQAGPHLQALLCVRHCSGTEPVFLGVFTPKATGGYSCGLRFSCLWEKTSVLIPLDLCTPDSLKHQRTPAAFPRERHLVSAFCVWCETALFPGPQLFWKHGKQDRQKPQIGSAWRWEHESLFPQNKKKSAGCFAFPNQDFPAHKALIRMGVVCWELLAQSQRPHRLTNRLQCVLDQIQCEQQCGQQFKGTCLLNPGFVR